MRHTMSGLTCALALGLFAFAAQAAHLADKSIKQQYDAGTAQADADYKAATEACKSKQGNDKDICMEQAKAARDKAKADAKATRKSADAIEDAREDKMAAEYIVAKERCDSLCGDAKDACIKNAKLKYQQ